MKILVVLGKNSFGSLVVQALGSIPDTHVFASEPVAGASECPVALTQPSTFDRAADMDVIIDCTDPLVDGRPDSLADWCLRNGALFVETTAHVPTLEALYFDVRRRFPGEDGARGSVLLGAGLTPGLANLLARELAEPENVAQRVEVFFDGHPPSTAALSRVEQLGDLLRANGARYLNGERIETPPVGPSVRLLDGHDYVRVCRAEALMLAWTGFASTTATYARAPRLPLAAVSQLLRWLPRRAGAELLARGAAFQARVGRHRGPASARQSWPSTITAMAGRRGDAKPSGSQVSLHTNDADWAAACAAAVMAVEARRSSARSRPLVLPDQVFRLEPMLERMRAIGGAALKLDHRGSESPVVQSIVPEPSRRSLPLVGEDRAELGEAQVA